MVFTLISVFKARRVKHCLVKNGFNTNISNLSKASEKRVSFRMVFTLISVF